MTRQELIALAERIKHRLDEMLVPNDESWLAIMRLWVQEMALDITTSSPHPTVLIKELKKLQRDRSYEDVLSALNEHPDFDPQLTKEIREVFDAYRKL
jgi:hypothetical protein